MSPLFYAWQVGRRTMHASLSSQERGGNMKIGIQTWGSHGDIRPLLALAEGLQADGNEVHLVLTCVDSDAYAGLVSQHGVRITVLASPVLDPALASAFARSAWRERNPMKQVRTLLGMAFAPVEDIMFEAARSLCAESDVVIGQYFMYPLQIAAEEAGRPYVSVLLTHAAVPSAFHHPINGGSLGKPLNRALWRLVRVLLNRTFLEYPNRLRARLGMPLVRDVMRDVWLSPHLALVAVSPRICQVQPDWPAAVRACGFLDTPNLAIEGPLPPALEDFMAAGEAPLYMTLGSWMPLDAEAQGETVALLTQAAMKAGCRAIIQAPLARACGFVSSERILYVGTAPHHAIFPRCRAVVHHGGAGTTQSATLAGKPSIVIAHLNEQEHWAGELRRLGVAGRVARRRSVTPAALARRIRAVLASAAMADKAAALGAAMRQEDGVAEAVRLVRERFQGENSWFFGTKTDEIEEYLNA
jgi:UDP:flavonoid glycosyltransferase YjiC (YdhE family)